jgi:hypothetical protein
MKCTAGLLVTAALLSGQRLALGGDSLVDRMRACGTEADDAKRLACYDFAIGRSKSGENDDLGVTGELLRHKRREAGLTEAPPKDMSGKVVAIARPPFGKFVVILDNGQVWAQQELLDFSVEVGDVITIRSGLLGALWMTNGNRVAQTRVQRIK